MPTCSSPAVDVRRSAGRYRTTAEGVDTRHAFSSGPHYDPDNTSFGLLVLHDEHLVAPGAGFPEHRHRGVEVVTWVLDGAVRHEDSAGHSGVVAAGQVQRMTAGRGVLHGESHAGGDVPVRFVQAWLPDADDVAPSYQQRDVRPLLREGRLVAVASGRHRAAPVQLRTDAVLHVARLPSGQTVDLPAAPYLHLFVAGGAVELGGAGPLAVGDAARLTSTPARRVTATSPAELLVWEMHAALSA